MRNRLLLVASIALSAGLISMIFIGAGQVAGQSVSAKNRLIVHEWGTMTSVIMDGAPATWRPLSEPSDLPDFVYGMGSPRQRLGIVTDSRSVKASQSGTVRMETPVVYFYSERPITATAKVDFPQGNITEWYPQGQRQDSGLSWNAIQVLPGFTSELPVDSKQTDSRYYAARATDSAPVRVLGNEGLQDEKFLFYRGVGTFDMPLSVHLEGDTVSVASAGPKAPQVILFENHNGEVRYQIANLADNQAVFSRESAVKTMTALRGDLISMLQAAGLYPQEARAMLNTWGDQWFEEGLRIFYIMPRKTVDSVIPMTIDPAPTEMKRVIVCRTEVITPEKEAAIREAVANLGDESVEVRDLAAKVLNRQGRFLKLILENLQEKTGDAAIKARIDDLMAKIPSRP